MKSTYGCKSAIKFLEYLHKMCKEVNCCDCDYYSLCHKEVNCFQLDSAPDGWDDFIAELKEIYEVEE